jgi:hypothetical protein
MATHHTIIAIIISSLSIFALGGIWYSPRVFGDIWAREANIDFNKPGHAIKVYGNAFILGLIAATGFSYIINNDWTIQDIMLKSLVVGVTFVAASFGVNYAFAGRSFKLFLIDSGYHIVKFLIFGLIFSFLK